MKVCGVTRPEDVELALDLGVDALGFNFVPGTPRALDWHAASRLCAIAEGRALRVGVFCDAPRARLLEVARKVGLDVLQLHGAESPALASGLDLPVIKALPGDPQGVAEADAYPHAELLLDHPSGGGSGRSWAFEAAAPLIAAGRRVWLAGGLGPETVGAALAAVTPFGVDACSSLESRPGVKDAGALRSFVTAVRECASPAS